MLNSDIKMRYGKIGKTVWLEPEVAAKWDSDAVKQFLKNGNSVKHTVKRVKKLLSFLNEIKNTFFATPNKFKAWSDRLERHISHEEFNELVAEVLK